jgi:hypothetical protein
MAEVNKISSFKSFSEIKAQENEIKLREENNLKKQETLVKIEEILDEMGLTSLSEIDEDSQQTFISKLLGREMNEGNTFVYAAAKAKADGKTEFEFNGKTYKVTIKDTGVKESVEEGNAFGDAVAKAKEAGEKEFEFDGKTYKVEESEVSEGVHGMATKLLQSLVDGETSKVEGVKMSKELAQHYIDWIRTSPYGKKNGNLPLNMLIDASFNWGIERGTDANLKSELKDLKGSIKESFLVTEGTRGQFGKIDKKGNITAVYTHYDSYPENVLPIIKKSYKNAKDVDAVIAKGDNSGLEVDFDKINFYGKNAAPYTGKVDKIKNFIKLSQDDAGAEYIYLFDERNSKWYMVDIYGGGELVPAFESFESVEAIDEARSITKIQNEWSKLTTTMQATAQNWKAAEGAAKEMLLGKLKEMTAQKKGLEAELEAVIADKDKDLELAVSEAFFRLPKDVIGNELYSATQNLANLYGSTLAGNDIDAGVIDTVIKALNTVKKSIKKFNDKEEVLGTVYEGAVKQFDADFNDMVKNIKSGYGWIDPEYVADTWENSSDSIDFELVKGEIYKRLIAANLLAYADEDDEESAGKKVKSLKELGIKESVVTEAKAKGLDWIIGELGDKPRCYDVADFVYTNYNKVTGLKKSMRNDEMDFPEEIMDVVDHYGLDIDEFTDCYGMAAESVVNEAEIKSDDEFKEYAMSVLKKAFGADFDEAKAGEVADGILKKCDGDYGACVGMLTSSLGESVTNEATIELDATDPKDKNLGKLLKKHNVTLEVINKKGPSGYPEVKLTGDVKDLKVVLADDEYGWDDEDLADYIEESTITEAIDVKYWEDYHEKSTKITSASKVARAVEDEVEEWNLNNEDGKDNEVTNGGEKKVMNLAHDFFKAAGWISSDVIQAMIAQES